MTITELLLNFRSALRSVAPLAERVGVPWRRPDAYDEWDDIATVLFVNLVAKVLQWSLVEDTGREAPIAAYDVLLESYENVNAIEVRHTSLNGERFVFHAFGTENAPFDIVEVRRTSLAGRPWSGNLETCPVRGAEFFVRLCNGRILSEVSGAG